MYTAAIVRRRAILRVISAVALATGFLAAGNVAGASSGLEVIPSSRVAAPTCRLSSAGNQIRHVIYIVFDNVHYTRDNPNVPSDLQQMPNLLNFLKNNGTLDTSEHTPLIAHTADDILTSMTGVYGDRHGQPVANSYDYFNAQGVPQYGASSFEYWTDTSPDGTPYMIDQQSKIAPAPWVPFTRAGCNFGAFSTANIELENTGSDLATVFGPNSPQVKEAAKNGDQAAADFMGISVHCAQGSSVCSNANGGVADKLPDEPGGYNDFNALFGAKYINPYLTGGKAVLDDLNGQPIEDGDKPPHPGFPGFDPTAAQSLAYTAAMQEHGIPITFSYIADTHDAHGATDQAYGPGEAAYVAQNRADNAAFGKFFTELAQRGINKSNTLFVVTADEGDHFAGTAPSTPGCNGVTTPCRYDNAKGSYVGEIDANMTGLLKAEAGITTPFDIHFDSAPVFYLNQQPSQTSETITRPFERAVARLTAINPQTKKTDSLTNYLADQAEMRLMHMMTADPLRDATFTDFADPNYYFQTYNDSYGKPCTMSGMVCSDSAYAWNHGDIGPDINRTFIAFVGPGVKKLGVTNKIWADHTDDRPTILALVGLKDDYSHEGRVLTQLMTKSGMNPTLRKDAAELAGLGAAYKQINAPVGQLSLDTVVAATNAMKSGSAAGDSEYLKFESEIVDLTNARNDLTSEIETTIENAEFNGVPLKPGSAARMIRRANGLLAWGEDMVDSYAP